MNRTGSRPASSPLDRRSGAAFWAPSLSVLIAPWLFGAWEMWWFWPLVIPILTGGVCIGLAMLRADRRNEDASSSRRYPPPVRAALWIWGVFLLYGLARVLSTPVYMTAERSLLLFLLPTLVWLAVSRETDGKRLRLFETLLISDLLLLGVYGIVNHVFFDSAYVMWVPGYEQYTSHHRATGSYFCPDHFAGVMEIGLAVGLALLLARDSTLPRRIASALLAAVSLCSIALTKSRGGAITVLVMFALALVWGFSQWRAYRRWCYRIIAAAAVGIGLILFANHAGSFMERLKSHPLTGAIATPQASEWIPAIASAFPQSDRGSMICGAIRAWKTNRAFGIGPGMHQNLWPRFAATMDGDRAAGIWPSATNEAFHSYEVHSDWVQILEEYGVVGAVMFTTAMALLLSGLLRIRRVEEIAWRRLRAVSIRDGRYGLTLAALLAAAAMAFHSLGDFNLQMPATGWLLAAVLALPFAGHTDSENDRETSF